MCEWNQCFFLFILLLVQNKKRNYVVYLSQWVIYFVSCATMYYSFMDIFETSNEIKVVFMLKIEYLFCPISINITRWSVWFSTWTLWHAGFVKSEFNFFFYPSVSMQHTMIFFIKHSNSKSYKLWYEFHRK